MASLATSSPSNNDDFRKPTFLFQNLSILDMNEMGDLSRKISDAEHLIRCQVMYFSCLTFQLIQNKPWNSTKPPVGVVGCGRVGKLILDTLLKVGWPPQSIILCRRDPNKSKDYRNLGVKCTNKHEALSACSLIILSVAPVHLRELMGQLQKHVHPINTIVVSVLAGVPASKIANAFNTKMILRPCFDVNRLPISWKDQGYEASNSFLNFDIDTREAYLRHAAQEFKSFPDALDHLVQTLRIFAVESCQMKEEEALALVRDLVYGRPDHAAGKLLIDQEVQELRNKCRCANGELILDKRAGTSKGGPSRTYVQIELFDTLRSCIKHKMLVPFQRCFRSPDVSSIGNKEI